ncbi:MAG: cobalt transporter CbiM [Jatrophihabitantaceae bacterium]
MHIPDGYLSPATCAVGYAVVAPMVAASSRQVRKRVKNRQVPTLAMLSAMCFLVMMFNIPIPDGTTAHAIGGVLVAVLLGPWAGLIAVSVALAFQALLFGDGGVLVYGVNVFNMAIVLPFVGYGVYRLIAGRASLTAGRRAVAAAIGGYLGLNASALACAIELGIQPDLFHNAQGAPLYSPYHLSQTIPAMMLAHLTVAGAVEAVLTGGVIGYLQRANLPLLRINHPNAPVDEHTARVRRPSRLKPIQLALIAVVAMVVLTPIGLLAPGGAFGEESPDRLDLKKTHLSAVPTGLQKYNGFWHHAMFNGYDFGNDAHPALGYLLSAVVGIAVIALVVFGVTYLALRISRARREPRDVPESPFAGVSP